MNGRIVPTIIFGIAVSALFLFFGFATNNGFVLLKTFDIGKGTGNFGYADFPGSPQEPSNPAFLRDGTLVINDLANRRLVFLDTGMNWLRETKWADAYSFASRCIYATGTDNIVGAPYEIIKIDTMGNLIFRKEYGTFPNGIYLRNYWVDGEYIIYYGETGSSVIIDADGTVLDADAKGALVRKWREESPFWQNEALRGKLSKFLDATNLVLHGNKLYSEHVAQSFDFWSLVNPGATRDYIPVTGENCYLGFDRFDNSYWILKNEKEGDLKIYVLSATGKILSQIPNRFLIQNYSAAVSPQGDIYRWEQKNGKYWYYVMKQTWNASP